MIIANEAEVLNRLSGSQKVLLIEPPYKRKYIPLGLAKISSFCKSNQAEVEYTRDCSIEDQISLFDSDGLADEYDTICITSLFTYESDTVFRQIEAARKRWPKSFILVGGIFASLMHKKIAARYAGMKNAGIFAGYSRVLDQIMPDYSMDWGVESPWREFAYTFTTRGCINNCSYCAVKKLESAQWINPHWKELIDCGKQQIMISDNNLSSVNNNHLFSVIDFLHRKDKKVIFDNGFDCKYITKELADKVARLKFTRSGMRLAFDRIDEDGVFQQAVQILLDAGVSKSHIMAYVLFNFDDTPQDADYRARECRRLGIRPYPQMYSPLNRLNREKIFVGKHWTLALAREFRFFWLMAGMNTKMSFDEYAAKSKKLSADDLAIWKSRVPSI